MNINDVVAAAGEPLQLVSYETIGWHGTTPDAANDIIMNGFDLGLCKQQSWLGPGVYFYEDWHGQRCSSDEAAKMFVKEHRNRDDAAVVKVALKFKKYFSIDRNHCDFYRNVRKFIVKTLSDTELAEIGSRIENFIIKCIDLCFPNFKARDGIGKCFDNTPRRGMSHAMVVVLDLRVLKLL